MIEIMRSEIFRFRISADLHRVRLVKRETIFALAFVFLPLSSLSASEPTRPTMEVDYFRDVKPLLKERCYTCHGALKQEGSLRLDTVELILIGGDSGPVLVRNEPDKSLLIEKVSLTGEGRMPPEHEGEQFKSEQIAILRNWIASGVPLPEKEERETDPKDHWAFRAITRPDVPTVQNMPWVRNPVDAFVAQRHELFGLTPQREAPKSLLLRRIYFDLIGLPPSPEEIAAFETDQSADSYEKVVEKLLDDPRYGERWGRHWMDVWRYSDWWGLGDQLRNSQKHIWHWRDWIIESLNEDVGYDEMVRQMLAGDELYPHDIQRLRATGYLARNYFLFNRNQWMEETVEHVSKGFLGLTLNCTKCHEHKYDPITQEDFYRFRAFFEPYHVRMEFLPGEIDGSKDGFPIAFDGQTDLPTYRFVRGMESSPDKSKAIQPGIPNIVSFAPFEVQPVNLPKEFSQPERRVWVLDAHIAKAKDNVAKVETETATLEAEVTRIASELEKAEKATPSDNEANPEMDFLTFTPDELVSKWKPEGGNWEKTERGIKQTLDGQNRSGLRFADPFPDDFEIETTFVIFGGSLYRSVGISFDTTQDELTKPIGAQDSEQSIYISAHEPDPKLQAAHHQGGAWQYPESGKISRPIGLNKEYRLRLRVRGNLINASINDEHFLSYETPQKRTKGALLLTAFDAMAEFRDVRFRPLPDSIKLTRPGEQTLEQQRKKLLEKQGEVRILALRRAIATSELESIQLRVKALRLRWASEEKGAADSALQEEAKQAAEAALKSEKEVAFLKAKRTYSEFENKLAIASNDAKESLQKELATAEEGMKKAEQDLANPQGTFTGFVGAAWTPTRFFNSGADDPTVNFPETSSGRRTALATWITDRRNPLAARVAINHIWMRHLGTPLVPTVFDFGRKGLPPTHPELLDWLAMELIENRWSMKHIHRLIVTSNTYRMDSTQLDSAENLKRDPENKNLWRRSPTRLESQGVRDAVLSIAGMLDPTLGGPSVPTEQQNKSNRRSLYFFHSNNERNLFLTTFDEALVKDCYRREQSIVPQQALAMANSELVLQSSSKIGERVAAQSTNDTEFVQRAFASILNYSPSDDELQSCLVALEEIRNLPENKDSADRDIRAKTELVWVLLNHNDFVTIR